MKLYIAIDLLLLVVGIKAQAACGPEAVKVVSGDSYDQRFVVENLLKQDAKETPDVPGAADAYTAKTNYWLAKGGFGGSFVLDLGCEQTFQAVKLINVHNRWAKNMAAKQFK